eukprot:665520-Amphidinium_carterae.1
MGAAAEVNIPDKHRPNGKNVPADELRQEVLAVSSHVFVNHGYTCEVNPSFHSLCATKDCAHPQQTLAMHSNMGKRRHDGSAAEHEAGGWPWIGLCVRQPWVWKKSDHKRAVMANNDGRPKLVHKARAIKMSQLFSNITYVLKCQERENQNKQLITKMHKLEHEMQALKNELAVSRREKTELAERSAKMAKENLPVLERLEKLWAKSRDAVDALTADAELLSSMFREQVQENKNNIESRDGISQELSKVQKQLKSERLKNQFKEETPSTT